MPEIQLRLCDDPCGIAFVNCIQQFVNCIPVSNKPNPRALFKVHLWRKINFLCEEMKIQISNSQLVLFSFTLWNLHWLKLLCHLMPPLQRHKIVFFLFFRSVLFSNHGRSPPSSGLRVHCHPRRHRCTAVTPSPHWNLPLCCKLLEEVYHQN